MSIHYKNYWLESDSTQSPKTKQWSLSVTIATLKDKQGNASFKAFDAPNSFSTKEEADERSLNFGKEIIDGMHPNLKLNY